MTTRTEAIVAAIRQELERHPLLEGDEGLGRMTLVVVFDRPPRHSSVKQVLFKPEWRRDLP